MERKRIIEIIPVPWLSVEATYLTCDPLDIILAQEALEPLTLEEMRDEISQVARGIVNRMQIKTSVSRPGRL